MSVRIILITAGLFAILIGALFLFATDQAIQGFELGASDVTGRLLARAFAVALIALGVINLMSSFDAGSPALRAVVVGNLLVHIFNPVVDMAETFPWTAGRWGGLILHVVFIVAFGYLLINWRNVTKA